MRCGDRDLCLPGLIGSVFSVLQFLTAPLTGAISDCLGRRPMMLLSLVWVPIGRRGGQEHTAFSCPASSSLGSKGSAVGPSLAPWGWCLMER